jgi:hypothetical protein
MLINVRAWRRPNYDQMEVFVVVVGDAVRLTCLRHHEVSGHDFDRCAVLSDNPGA